ncbi:MAG: hypothetical protein KDA60_02250 [Planctomycetales bacterium]|nr:hypothetical protein [Planctomycetales bacterium]
MFKPGPETTSDTPSPRVDGDSLFAKIVPLAAIALLSLLLLKFVAW